MRNKILVGKIGAPHGIKGLVKVFSYTDHFDNILDYQPWEFVLQDKPLALTVLKTQVISDALLIQCEGVEDRDQAAKLTHVKVYVDRKCLPALAENEYYWSDLEGLTVYNTDGFCFGKITRLLNTGANDVMFIKGEKEYCLPYVPGDVVKKVDLAKQEMLVDWEVE